MEATGKSRSRRAEIRKNRPDAVWLDWDRLRGSGALASAGIAAAFFLFAWAILTLREQVIPYRPGQWIPHDIVSRVDFSYQDKDLLAQMRRQRREAEPRVYKPNPEVQGDAWAAVRRELLLLPDRVSSTGAPEDLPRPLAAVLDGGAVTALRQYAADKNGRAVYEQKVNDFLNAVRNPQARPGGPQTELFVLPARERSEDVAAGRPIAPAGRGIIPADSTVAVDSSEFRTMLKKAAGDQFMLSLGPQLAELTASRMKPTHVLDVYATQEAANLAAAKLPAADAVVKYPANSILVPRNKNRFDDRDWDLLRAENEAYRETLGFEVFKSQLGLLGTVAIVTMVLSLYVGYYQPRIVRNHARGVAIAGLLLSMLLVAQVAAIGHGPLYLFGLAPTILVAVILTIAYDQRFAIGVASIHGFLVTFALGQGIHFFLIIWVGVLTACFLLDDIRTRSKLIEVGGATAIAMALAAAAAGALSLDPLPFVVMSCLYAAAAGLVVGFIVLGILPFIERAFRITTSMTLLELADGGQPLLCRLAMEAPGTYNHSLQVATLAEAAAEAIGANSLLCRVGSYYHDVGKINKADYFIENQQPGGQSRHLNLSPSVSLLIIIGHVKDGVELAREYNLPTSFFPFIQQHHGTTLVEFFYHQACSKNQSDGPAISEAQYRYPGPKPRSKEIAIVMLADAVESAARSMSEPTGARVEALVHELSMKRLLDGQFDECDLTMRELELIERSMMKTLLAIYHGRIAYPSMSRTSSAAAAAAASHGAPAGGPGPGPAIKSA
jgi:putative nucleotidyltransferase with HDIG domain